MAERPARTRHDAARKQFFALSVVVEYLLHDSTRTHTTRLGHTPFRPQLEFDRNSDTRHFVRSLVCRRGMRDAPCARHATPCRTLAASVS